MCCKERVIQEFQCGSSCRHASLRLVCHFEAPRNIVGMQTAYRQLEVPPADVRCAQAHKLAIQMLQGRIQLVMRLGATIKELSSKYLVDELP